MRSFILFTVLLIVARADASVLLDRTESFDVDPGWSVVGSGTTGSSFGYRPLTANAGGDIGEGGGLFTRQTFAYFYADTDLFGDFNLDTAFSASGRLDVTQFQTPDFGTALILGHFDQTGQSQIGIVFTDNSTGVGGQLFWGPRLQTADGNSVFPNNGLFAIDANVDRFWSYSWDPDGGGQDTGRLTTTLSGPGGGTIVLDINPFQRAAGASFDAFGINNTGATNAASSNRNMSLFIDDVTYSTAQVIPEPGSIIVWSVLATVGFGASWWRRSRT